MNQMTTLPALTPQASAITRPDEIAARLNEHAQDAKGAYAQNTTRALKADSAVFSTWCADRGLEPLPALPETVVAFIDDMAQLKAVATIKRYVASIAHLHRAADLGEPTRSQKVRLALKRIARAKGTRQKQAAPLNRSTLDAIVASAGDRLIDKRNAALFAVAYDSLVRRSALVALDVADLAFNEDGAGSVLIRREKTDQEGAGSVRFLARDTVTHLRTWLTAAGIMEGSLFRSISRHGVLGGRLSDAAVPEILRKQAVAAGIDPKGLSGHSTRVGAAQDMLAAGLSDSEVRHAGGWGSTVMVARYGERLLASRGAAAKLARAQGRA